MGLQLISAARGAVTSDNALGRTLRQATRPRIVSLITGQDHEVFTCSANCSQSADTVNFKLGDRGHKLTFSASGTHTAYLDPVGVDDPIILSPRPSAVGMWVFVPTGETGKITSVSINIFSDSGASVNWSRSFSATPDGWNFGRWSGHESTATNWGTIYRARIVVGTNAATNLTVGHAWAEQNAKAQILMIADGPYESFRTGILPELRARGIPVTWAVDPTALGTGAGAALRMTEAAVLAELANFPNDEPGVHGWDGTATSAMTEDQLRIDSTKPIQWWENRGYGDRVFWRAAFVQNSAAQHAKVQGIFPLGYATPTGTSSLMSWPPPNRFNIPRTSIHGRSNQDFIDAFTPLLLNRQMQVWYTHGLNVAGGNDSTPTELANWLAQVDAGFAAGTLEAVTYGQMLARVGVIHRAFGGDWVTNYADAAGVTASVRLP